MKHLAERVTELHYRRVPDLAARYGPVGREKCLQDAAYHLDYLAQAVSTNSPALFLDYVAWAKVMLEGRGVGAADLVVNLQVLRDVVQSEFPEAAALVEQSLKALESMPVKLPSLLRPENPHTQLCGDFMRCLRDGRRREASAMILRAVAGGVPLRDIYLHVFQRSQHEIGRLWQMNQMTVAEEHYCTAATQMIMSQLYPYLFGGERNGLTLVAACVAGDLHEIGLRMVADFFEMAGWDTFFVGANAPTRDVVSAVVDRRADCLALSATISFHLRAVEDLIKILRADPRTRAVPILVGGYPFNLKSDLWRQIGADGCARDADAAVAEAHRLVQRKAS